MRASRRLPTLAAAVTTAVLVPAFAVESDERVAPRLEPTASLPSAEVPSVSVPETPSVDAPDIPSVQTPDTSVAPVPDTPAVQTPDVPSTAAPDAPAAAVPAAPGGDGSAGQRSTGAAGGGTASGSGGGEPTATRERTNAGRQEKPAERRRDARRRRAARERRFRARVERLRGCFGSLSDGERRVLTLRAGLDDEAPHSVAQVADELDVRRSEVRSTERRALRRLRRADRATGCGGPVGGGAQSISSPGGGTLILAQLPRLRAIAALGRPAELVPIAEMGDRNEVLGARASSDASGGAAAASGDSGSGSGAAGDGLGSAVGDDARTVATAGGGGTPLWPILLAGALALLVVSLVTARQQRGSHAAAGTAGARARSPEVATMAGAGAVAPPPEHVADDPPAAAAPPEPDDVQTASSEAPPGDTAVTAASSPDSAVAPASPGDPAAAPGPPAAAAAAGAAAGAEPEEERDTTVVRRRTGGLIGAARPAGEQAARAARGASQRLRDIARRARDRGR